MEPIIVLSALSGGAFWLGNRLYQASRSAYARRACQQEADASALEREQRERIRRQRQVRDQRQRQREQQNDLNKKYRALQVALLQISQAPDFQRAAAYYPLSIVIITDNKSRYHQTSKNKPEQHSKKKFLQLTLSEQ